MDPSGQAAWVQGIGTILAIAVAIWIPYWQRSREHAEKASNDRKVVMSAAANLDIALSYQATIFRFMPADDGKIGHDALSLEQARHFMKLQNAQGYRVNLTTLSQALRLICGGHA